MIFATAQFGFSGPLAPPGYLSNASAVGQREKSGAMPRIPDKLLSGVAFMYRNAAEAADRVRLGGSAFLVGRLLPGSETVFGAPRYLPFLISNRHVVFEGSACVASVNRKGEGPPEIWDLDQNDWHAHPAGDDLAGACVLHHVQNLFQTLSFIRESDFILEPRIEALHIGVGDDVFMIGRFVNHQGHGTNLPAVRFGNISVMPTDLWTKDALKRPRPQLSYAVEMRSRTGFSGAPVCLYRAENSSLMDVPKEAESFWGLLGVNWGYVMDEEGENTWLNGVVPAWKIMELLDAPALRAIYDQECAEIAMIAAAVTEDRG